MANINWLPGNLNVNPNVEGANSIFYMDTQPEQGLDNELFNLLFGQHAQVPPAVHPFNQRPVPGQPLEVDTPPIPRVAGVPDSPQWGLRAYVLANAQVPNERFCVEWLVQYFAVAHDAQGNAVNVFAAPQHYQGNQHEIPAWLPNQFYPVPGQNPAAPYIFPNGQAANLIGQFVQFNNWNNAAPDEGPILVLEECHWVWDNVGQGTPVARSLSSANDHVRKGEAEDWLEAVEYFAKLKLKSKSAAKFKQEWKATKKIIKKGTNVEGVLKSLSYCIGNFLGMKTHKLLAYFMQRTGKSLDQCESFIWTLFVANTSRGSPKRPFVDAMLTRSIMSANGGSSANKKWNLIDARLYPVPVIRSTAYSRNGRDLEARGDFLFAPVSLAANETVELEAAFLEAILEVILESPTFSTQWQGSKLVFAGNSPKEAMGGENGPFIQKHKDKIVLTTHIAHEFHRIHSRKLQKVNADSMVHDFQQVLPIIENYGVNNPDKEAVHHSAVDVLHDIYQRAGVQAPNCPPPRSLVTASKARASFSLSVMDEFLPTPSHGHCPAPRNQRRQAASVPTASKMQRVGKVVRVESGKPARSRPWGLNGRQGILLTKSNQQQLDTVIRLPAIFLQSNSGQQLALLLENRQIAYDCMTCCFTLEGELTTEASTARTADVEPIATALTNLEGLEWNVAINSQVLRSAVEAQQELFEQGCMIFAPMAKLLTMLRQRLQRGKCLQKPLLVKATLNNSASRLDLSVYEYAEGGTNNYPLYWHGENNCDEAFWEFSTASKRIGLGILDGALKMFFRRSFFDGLKTRGALRTQSLYKHGTANRRTFVEHRNGTFQQARKKARAYIAPNPELFIGDKEFLDSCLPVSTKVGNETLYQSYRPLVVLPTGAIQTISERLACKSQAEFSNVLKMTGGFSFQKASSGKTRKERRVLHSDKGAPFGSRPAVKKRTNPFQVLETCSDDDEDDDDRVASPLNDDVVPMDIDESALSPARPETSSNAIARARAYALNATEKVVALPPHLIERPEENKKEQYLVPQPQPDKNGKFTRKHYFTLRRKLAGPKHQLQGVLSAKSTGAPAELKSGMEETLKNADVLARSLQAELALARRDAIDLRQMQASIKVSLNQAFVAEDQRKDSLCAQVCAQVNIISGQLQHYLGQPVGSAELAQGQVAQPGDHNLIEEEEEEEGDFVEQEVEEALADGDDDKVGDNNPFGADEDEDEEELRLDRSYGLAGSKIDIVQKLNKLLTDTIFHFDDQKLEQFLGLHLNDDDTPSFKKAVARIRQLAALSYDLSRAEAFPAPMKKHHKLLELFRALDNESELDEAERLVVIETQLNSVPQERLRVLAMSLLEPYFDQMKVERATEQQQQGGTVASADDEKAEELEWDLTFNPDGSVVCTSLPDQPTVFPAPELSSSERPHVAIQLFNLLNAQAPKRERSILGKRKRQKSPNVEEYDTTGAPKQQAHKIRYENGKVTLSVAVKSDFKAITIALRLRCIIKLLCKTPLSIQGLCDKLDAVGAAGLTLQAVTGIGCDFFVTKKLIKSSVAQILCVGVDRQKALGTKDLVIPSQMLNAVKSYLVDMLAKVRTARAPKRASLPLPNHPLGPYQLFATTGSQDTVENSVITLASGGYKAETDQILLVYGLAASFRGSARGVREELYFGNRMEIVLPKGSILKIGIATLFPYLVQDGMKQSHLACNAHVTFSMELPNEAYANVCRKTMRRSLLSAVRRSTNSANERQQSPATSFPLKNSWAETVASEQVQEALARIDESLKTTRCKEREKVQIAKRLASDFDAAHLNGQTPRAIPAQLRIGKGQKTMKEIGLEGYDEILYYDLPVDRLPADKAKRFDCLKAAGLEMPVFLDLGFRCIADAYSPGDQRVYILGKGKLSTLLGRFAREHDKLRSKRDLLKNKRAGERLETSADRHKAFDLETERYLDQLSGQMEQVMKSAKRIRTKLYRSLATFLVSCFDYVCISDLSSAQMLKQPNVGKTTKRKLGLLAIEEFRTAVKNACNALSNERRTLCNPKQDEASTTATLHCCKLSSFGFHFSKCIRCPYGCTTQEHGAGEAGDISRARQERDGAAGKTLGAKVYWEPSQLAKVRLYDFVHANAAKNADIIQKLDEMYEQVGRCLLQLTATFGHDTKALPATSTYAGVLNLPLFPTLNQKKVKWVETQLTKALRQRYSDRQRQVLLTQMSQILPPKSPREEITEGRTGYSV